MKRIKVLLLTCFLVLSSSFLVFADNHKETANTVSPIKANQEINSFWGGRDMTIFRYYSSSNNAPAALDYREYQDNCWWEGSLPRQGYPEYDSSTHLWKATFSGKIYKKDCYDSGVMFLETHYQGTFHSLLTAGIEQPMYNSKFKEIKKAYDHPHDVPGSYYYEEWDSGLGCTFGGTLHLSTTYNSDGKIIAVYTGYIAAAC